jgi:hypothetical protein
MSLTALKRKSQAMRHLSTGQPAFSLNNSRRIENTVCNNSDDYNKPRASVKSNHAMLAARTTWLNRGYPHNVVQPLTQESFDQLYSKKVSNALTDLCNPVSVVEEVPCVDVTPVMNPKNKMACNKPKPKPVVAPEPLTYAMYYPRLLRRKRIFAPENNHYPPPVSRNSSEVMAIPVSLDEFKDKNKPCPTPV